MGVSKITVTGWIIFLFSTAIWLYGYFVAGHPSIIDWHANAPWWIADDLPHGLAITRGIGSTRSNIVGAK